MRFVWAALAVMTLFCQGVTARELFPGQYADVPPETRQWFRSQKVPGGEYQGSFCCNEADGVYAEEDMINGQYWTRWRVNDDMTPWQPVPPEAVIPQGNRNGSPVVWYWYKDGELKIRCYAPGGGV
jgi:hypothetical protein